LNVRAVAAAPDFLWVGAKQGLFRFDGEHFHQIGNDPIEAVAVTQDGVVWAGGPLGLFVYVKQRDGAYQPRNLLQQAVSGVVARGNQIVASADFLWTGTTAGLQQLNVKANGSLSLDAKQGVWFGCGESICEWTVDERINRTGVADGLLPGTWHGAIADKDGNLWAWDIKRTISLNRATAKARIAGPGQWGDTQTLKAVTSHTGRIWLDRSVWIEQGQFHLAEGVAPTGIHHQAFAEDAKGQMWIGSNAGLGLLSAEAWVTPWHREFPAGTDSVMQLKAGGMITATPTGGLLQLDADQQNWLPLPGPFGQGRAWAAIETSGGLWAILEGRGILRMNSAGQQTGTAFGGSTDAIPFRCFLRDRSGQLWTGSKKGLFRVDETAPKLKQVQLPGDLNYAASFTTDSTGQEWLGYDGGIARLENGQWKLVVPASYLLSNRIRSLAVTPGPVFWVSYRTPLPASRIAKQGTGWSRQDINDDGYPAAESFAVLADRRGWIWRGTERGLRISDGRQWGPGDWLDLNELQSLPGNSVRTFGLFEDRDGAVWVSTNAGVARVTPGSGWFGGQSPRNPLRITALRLAGREYTEPDQYGGLEGGGSDLEIDFAAWPDSRPGRRSFEYRLLPADTNWHVGTATTAHYPSLPAGDYRFEVRHAGDVALQLLPLRIRATARFPWLPWGGAAGVCAGAGFYLWRRAYRARFARQYWRERNSYVAPPSDAQEFAPGERVADRYIIEDRIGEGGFAKVYRAHDTVSHAVVALKVLKIRDEFPDSQRQRFLRETEALRKLTHPGIVHLLDAGILEDEAPYVVMNYIEGPNLRAVLDRQRLCSERTARWLRQVGDALAVAHRASVLHRDLKPENILIQSMGQPDEQPVIADFGAATIQETPGQDGSTVMLVSMHYTAPERVRGRSSPQSDVYSFSVIAFEMLTGERFSSLVDDEVEMQRSLSAHPEEVVRLLRQGTHVSPSARPSDISQFARSLAAAIHPE